MSDLVEKVQKAMAFEMNRKEDGWVHYEHEARAAIAAVAEWLEQDHGDDWFKARHLRAQMEQPKGAAGDGR